MLLKNSRRALTADHKIKLQKQLSRALKKTGYEGQPRNEGVIRPHQDFKPCPTTKTVRRRDAEAAEQLRQQEEREAEAKERQQRRMESTARRHMQKKRLSTKTQRGQPNLNNHIKALLDKLKKK